MGEKQLKEIKDKLMNVGFDHESRSKEGDSTLATIEDMKESVIKANEQLVECRRTLKYTYVFAYYNLQKKPDTTFEFQQEMLEKFTEELSGLTEKPLSEIKKLDLVNKTEAVNHFIDNICDIFIK